MNHEAILATQSRRRRMQLMRHHGFSGGLIAQHRALLTLPLKPTEGWLALVLALLLLLGWLFCLPWVSTAWTWGMESLSQWLFAQAPVKHDFYTLGSYLQFKVPYIDVTAGVPAGASWWMALFLTTLMVFISFVIPRRHMPLIYFLRAFATIQTIALIYFAINPASFPYTVAGYQSGLLLAGLLLISFVPILLGATFYIFDFGLPKKLFLTVVTMSYLCLLVPLQYLVHVYLIHEYSMLFMPILFFFFGLPLDVFVFIAFYAWGMSWKNRRPRGAFA